MNIINFLVSTGLRNLHACGQQAVNFFHLVDDSVSTKHLKGMAQNIICI